MIVLQGQCRSLKVPTMCCTVQTVVAHLKQMGGDRLNREGRVAQSKSARAGSLATAN